MTYRKPRWLVGLALSSEHGHIDDTKTDVIIYE